MRLEPASGDAELLSDGLTRRRAFKAHAPSTLTWTVTVPPEGRLETHLSFSPEFLDPMAGQACRAHVGILPGRGGEPSILVERTLEPHREWDPYLAELDRWAGREVQVSLGVECRSDAGRRTWPDAVRWAVPVVWSTQAAGVTNVLLITVDTLRADRLGAYGHSGKTSTNIDRLAERGLLFLETETPQSATWPALASLHTSLYPSAHGVVWNGHDLAEGALTLASLLHARSYSTSAFLTNMKQAHQPGFARHTAARFGDQAQDDVEATSAALEQLRIEKGRPFFLWLHLVSPHASYEPLPPWDTAFTSPGASDVSGDLQELVRIREEGQPLAAHDVNHVRGLYDGEVGWVDTQVGRVLDELEVLDLEQSTLVVFTSDHGEDLYEHHRYFFHSPSMYSSSLRIPLILALPGVLPEGATTAVRANLVDLAPTILGLLDLPAPPVFQGRDLLQEGGVADTERPLFSETNGRIYGVSTPRWRLILNPEGRPAGAPGGAYPIEEVELYDREADPLETANVAPSHPEVVRELTDTIAAWRGSALQQEVPSQEIDPETLEELRALGYVFE